MVKENWCHVWLNRLASGSWLVRSAFLYYKAMSVGQSTIDVFLLFFD